MPCSDPAWNELVVLGQFLLAGIHITKPMRLLADPVKKRKTELTWHLDYPILPLKVALQQPIFSNF